MLALRLPAALLAMLLAAASALADPADLTVVVRCQLSDESHQLSADWNAASVDAKILTVGDDAGAVMGRAGLKAKVDESGVILVSIPAAEFGSGKLLMLQVRSSARFPYYGSLKQPISEMKFDEGVATLEFALKQAEDRKLRVIVVRGPTSQPVAEEPLLLRAVEGGGESSGVTDSEGRVDFKLDASKNYQLLSLRPADAAAAFKPVSVTSSELRQLQGPFYVKIPEPAAIVQVFDKSDPAQPMRDLDGWLVLRHRGDKGIADYSGRWDGSAFAFASLPEGEFEVMISNNERFAGRVIVEGGTLTYKLPENAGGKSHRLVVSEG